MQKMNEYYDATQVTMQLISLSIVFVWTVEGKVRETA